MNDHLRYYLWLGLIAMLAVVGVALASFQGFVNGLAPREPDDAPQVQGIVVLTGGADRLADGLRLLEQERGGRLLVSGVHPGTSLNELKRLMPEHARLLACCVDLDHAASNTRGNARETARWARRHGFSTLAVVTATYHVPRTRLEFTRLMPRATLHFYPVVPDAAAMRNPWSEPHLLRILLLEYGKLRLAELRIRLGFAAPPEEGT